MSSRKLALAATLVAVLGLAWLSARMTRSNHPATNPGAAHGATATEAPDRAEATSLVEADTPTDQREAMPTRAQRGRERKRRPPAQPPSLTGSQALLRVEVVALETNKPIAN